MRDFPLFFLCHFDQSLAELHDSDSSALFDNIPCEDMAKGDVSFRKKPGWTEVEKRSNIIVPQILGVGDFPLVVLWVVLLVYQAL